MLPQGFLHQDLERALGSFKLKPLVFELFEVFENLAYLGVLAFEVNLEFGSFVKNARCSGEVRDKNSLTVSDTFGLNVFIGRYILPNGAHMDSGLVGKGAFSYVGLISERGQVGEFRDKTGDLLDLC